MDSDVSVHDKITSDDQLKSYYETISFTDQKKSISENNEVGNNSQLLKGKKYQMSRHDIMKKSKFGKPSLSHTFTSEATFEHVLIFLLRSGYLPSQDENLLLDTHPLFKHLNDTLKWSSSIEFMDLRNPIENYQDQKTINIARVRKMLAAVCFYNLDIPTIIRFLGNNYTGEYRNINKILQVLEDTRCDIQVIKDLERLFCIGSPNRLNATSTHKNYLDYFRYGNHSSILKDEHKTLQAMNKEDRNQFLITLPSWIARFIRHSHLTPQGLLSKPGKNDRLIWDGSFLPNWDSTCINMMLSHETEPTIIYGDAFQRHLETIWNLRITYPTTEILLFDDDVKSAFRQCKYHPDVASAFSFIIKQYLFIPLGGTFGSITSPANFEPIARARIHLAHHLSNRRDLYLKYKDIIDRVQFSDDPSPNTTFTQAKKDSIHVGVVDADRTKFNMFVDDNLFAQTKGLIKHAMAASIEALYMVLGYPDIEKRQNPLSLDKYFESVCSYTRIQLGISINTRTMMINLTEKKRIAMLDELSHWHKDRKSFTLLQGVILCGSLEFWAITSPWVRFIYHQLRSCVNKCLFNCSSITKNKSDIKKLITEVANSKDTEYHVLKEKMMIKTIAKETYKCRHKAYIDKSMRSELSIMKNILANPKMYNLGTPISHLIGRDPDFVTYGDACLEAGGGYSENLFWWHIEWPQEIKSLTLKNITVTRKCHVTNELVSINMLEFLVEIINYAAITLYFKNHQSYFKHEYPMLLNWTDNTTSKTWLRKAATRTQKGKALQHLLCSMMINNPVGIRAEYIAGKSNILADAISRVYTNLYSNLSFQKIFQEFPQMRLWRRFHPSQELLSRLYLALSQGQDQGLCPINNLGHFVQGNNIL